MNGPEEGHIEGCPHHKDGCLVILHMIPATGWRVLSFHPEDGSTYTEPLICWALVELRDNKHKKQEEARVVEGMVACGNSTHFADTGCIVRYLAPGQDEEDYKEEAVEAYEEYQNNLKEEEKDQGEEE